MNDTNGRLYMALMGQFGKPRDVAAYSIMTIQSGPFLTMVTLGAAGLSAFPWQTLVGAVLPLVVGAILGNLDREMRVWLSGATGVLIPFFAFALGASIDLRAVWKAGLLGLLLGVAVFVVTGAVLIVADKLTGGTGVAGISAASTAGERGGRSRHRGQRQPRVQGGRWPGDRAGGRVGGGHRAPGTGRRGVPGQPAGGATWPRRGGPGQGGGREGSGRPHRRPRPT